MHCMYIQNYITSRTACHFKATGSIRDMIALCDVSKGYVSRYGNKVQQP